MLNNSDEELVSIILNKGDYVSGAINAAELEIKRRNISNEFLMSNKSDKELVNIFLNKGDYVPVVNNAADLEIKRRNISTDFLKKLELEVKAVALQKEITATTPLSRLIGISIFFASISLVSGFFLALIMSNIYKRKEEHLKASQCWTWFLVSILFWFLIVIVIIALNSN